MIFGLGLFYAKAQAQLNPLGSQYYHNQYLVNPSMAGMQEGFEVGAAIKGQWTAIDGAPLMQAVSLIKGSENGKVGYGLLFYNEQAGVLRRSSLKASYAYHLKLNDRMAFLDFGLSAGYMDEWIDFNKVIGDPGDLSLFRYNQRPMQFDVDFGMSYRSGGLKLQGVLPNIRRSWFDDSNIPIADKFRYLIAGSYKMPFSSGTWSLEPMLVYRNVQNYGDIFDIGTAVYFQDEKLFFNAIYHTTNSATLGMGTNYKKQLSIMFQYTTNTSDLQGYSNGEAELALKLRF